MKTSRPTLSTGLDHTRRSTQIRRRSFQPPSLRPNRRRVRHPILRAVAGLLVWVVALLVLIGILMKVGFLQDPNEGGGHGILAQCVVAARSA
jgi:hypothetical protein